VSDDLAKLIQQGSELAGRGDFRAALGRSEKALALFDQLDARSKAQHRADHAAALSLHGELLADLGDPDEGRRYLLRALSVYDGMDPADPLLWNGNRAQTLLNLAASYARQRSFSEALQHAQSAVQAAGGSGGPPIGPEVALRGAALVTVARLQNELGHTAEALAALEQAAGSFEQLTEQNPDAAFDLFELGMTLTATPGNVPLRRLASLFVRIAPLWAQRDRRDTALAVTERAIQLLRALPPDGQTRLQLAAALGNLGSWLDESGDHTAAIGRAREAYQLAEQCVAEGVSGARPVLWQTTFNLVLDLINNGELAPAQRLADFALGRIDASSPGEATWAAQLRDLSVLARSTTN